MSNKLTEMSKVEDSKEGVDVRVTGDVQRGTVECMLEKCDIETCCGPELFERISDISVSGQDGAVTIHVAGSVTPEMVEPKLTACDCYEEQLVADTWRKSLCALPFRNLCGCSHPTSTGSALPQRLPNRVDITYPFGSLRFQLRVRQSGNEVGHSGGGPSP